MSWMCVRVIHAKKIATFQQSFKNKVNPYAKFQRDFVKQTKKKNASSDAKTRPYASCNNVRILLNCMCPFHCNTSRF